MYTFLGNTLHKGIWIIAEGSIRLYRLEKLNEQANQSVRRKAYVAEVILVSTLHPIANSCAREIKRTWYIIVEFARTNTEDANDASTLEVTVDTLQLLAKYLVLDDIVINLHCTMAPLLTCQRGKVYYKEIITPAAGQSETLFN